MNYGEIKTYDIANGPGVRVSLFISGCTRYCPGCFNEEAWAFNFGKKFTDHTLNYILELSKRDYIDGLSILGGEPLHPKNIETVYEIVSVFKFVYPNKDIWLWSGYTYEELNERMENNSDVITKLIFKYIDVLVDGPFEKTKKDLLLRFRGSSNQRIIDIQKSKSINDRYKLDPVLWKDDDIFENHNWL